MRRYLYAGILCVSVLFCKHTYAQTQTVGLLSHLSGSEDDGYVLFSPEFSDTTYLIDKCGKLVHTWASAYNPGLDFYLLPDGTLLRSGNYPNPVFDTIAGSAGGIIERFDWNGDLLWHYVISDSIETQDHDICYMPNGDILVATWEVITDSAAIANGRNPAILGTSLWSAKIIEIQPVGTDSANIVWTWRVWDHLVQDYDATKPNYGVVADHPELLNFNYFKNVAATDLDWLHLNAVTYNSTLDQVMISFHNMDEIYIIDHSTDSVQAAGHTGGTHNHGGDFLYRWGNPAAYNRGTTANTKLFQQHDPTWIPYGPYANQIMVFNNGNGRSALPLDDASSADVIAPPVDSAGNYYIGSGVAYGPDSLTWTYESGVNFYSAFMGGAQPLTNGNTLICNAIKGQLFEVDSAKNIVWNYLTPVNNGIRVSQGTVTSRLDSNSVYRCTFYPSSYSGFAGQTLISGQPIELNPLPYSCTLGVPSVAEQSNVIKIMPNPANDAVTIEAGNLKTVQLMDITGRIIINGFYNNTASAKLNTAQLADGMYILCINGSDYQRVVIQH